LTDRIVLEIAFEGTRGKTMNVVFEYTRAGGVTPVDGIVHVIPDPTTMMLLAPVEF